DRLHLRRDQHRGIAVKANDRAIRALDVLGNTHHDRLHNVALLHAAAWNRFLDRHDDDVADGGVFALGAAKHLDAHDATRAGIVGHVEIGLHLNHDAALTVWSLITFTGLSASSRPGPRPSALVWKSAGAPRSTPDRQPSRCWLRRARGISSSGGSSSSLSGVQNADRPARQWSCPACR